MTNRIGKHIRLILIGNRFYSGIVLEETEILLTFKDKFNSEVSVGKNSIISLEVKEWTQEFLITILKHHQMKI